MSHDMNHDIRCGVHRTPPEPCNCLPLPRSTDTITKTLAERGGRYGMFKDHAEVTQTLKCVIRENLKARNKHLADDQAEALEMICHKIARIVNGDPDYADSWIDIAGYAKLVADRLNGVAR